MFAFEACDPFGNVFKFIHFQAPKQTILPPIFYYISVFTALRATICFGLCEKRKNQFSFLLAWCILHFAHRTYTFHTNNIWMCSLNFWRSVIVFFKKWMKCTLWMISEMNLNVAPLWTDQLLKQLHINEWKLIAI